MGGGLMQLVAYGAQDVYLTGNPQITFFKVVYRRHTNFSMETISQSISGSSTITSSEGNGSVTISRNGDLVHKMYVSCSDNTIKQGNKIVKEVTLEIGGQKIDTHTREWMDVVNELTIDESKANAFKSMTGSTLDNQPSRIGMVQIPLQFWFCRNPGLALPLIALQYHEVKLKFTWGTNSVVCEPAISNPRVKVWCDYVYLDTDERRRFAQVSHEYLIEQVQSQKAQAGRTQKLNFNHPVKELIWVSNAAYTNAKITLNGHDRFSSQEEEYFRLRQPFDHHTAVPRQNIPEACRHVSRSVEPTFVNKVLSANTATPTFTAGGFGGAADNRFFLSTNVLTIRSNGRLTPSLLKVLNRNQLIGRSIMITINTDATPTAGSLGFPYTAKILAVDNAASDDDLLVVNIGPIRKIGGAATFTFGNLDPGIDTVKLYLLDDIASASKDVGNEARTSDMRQRINCYSFALKPEEHQPSGTCNFSRIDVAKLETGDPLGNTDTIYAINYNVLRIMSGMGGLAYSN